jgi:hypothetical protein
MARITKSFKVDPLIWRELKIHCAEEEIEISEFLEKQIKRGIKK